MRRPRAPWQWLMLGWTALTLLKLLEVQMYLRAPFGRVVLAELPARSLWILGTPLIFAWNDRHRLQRPLRARAVLAHIAAWATIHCTFIAVWTAANTLVGVRNPAPTFGQEVAGWIPMSILSYGITIAIATALRLGREAAERAKRESELSAALDRAQLAALQAQIHPHFLFNALNTAVALSRDGQSAEATRVLLLLSDILRQFLARPEQPTVALREEVAFLERYLELQRIRFGERLAVHWEIDAATRDVQVPHFVLQPLVENAIRHGLSCKQGSGKLWVRSRIAANVLELYVLDDGVGPSASLAGGESRGVGLRNTRARLVRLYGEQASATLSPRATGGAEACVRIPLDAGGSSPTYQTPLITSLPT